MSANTPNSNDHVADVVFDYLEGRLPPDKAQAVRDHIETCRDCADLYGHAQELREDVQKAGSRHLSPDRLQALQQEGADAADTNERVHLAACRLCRDQLDWLQTVPPPMELQADAAAERIPHRQEQGAEKSLRERLFGSMQLIPRWGWGAVATAAACVFLLVVLQQQHDTSPAELARIQPLEIQWPRGMNGSSEFRESFRLGLDAYAAEEYAEAGEILQQAAELRPENTGVLLLLGSAFLLQGRSSDAIRVLERALQNANDPALAEECQWQLVNAHLAAGELQEAKGLLLEILATTRTRRTPAQDLLSEINAAEASRR